MLHWTIALYGIAVLFSGVRRLIRRVRGYTQLAFPEWSATRRRQICWLFWKSQIYAAIFESPIIRAHNYAGLISQLTPDEPKHAIARWQ
ncbi:MAG: hypothetical protein K0U66_08010 [Gammaproteobacteria bacterium]|nr:hypothetical protein [Gammaproteobacteria bacterium]